MTLENNMKRMRIHNSTNPFNGSFTGTPNRFLNYDLILADLAKRESITREYKAERLIYLKNSTLSKRIYMLIETTVEVCFEHIKTEMKLNYFNPQITKILDRQVSFYCPNNQGTCDRIEATFLFQGKSHTFDEITKIKQGFELFLYDDSELSISLVRTNSSRKEKYIQKLPSFRERVKIA